MSTIHDRVETDPPAVTALPAEAAAVAGPASSDPAARPAAETGIGMLYGLAAYGWWGVVPVYFRWMKIAEVAALELLAHRIIWSVLLLAVLLRMRGGGRKWLALFSSRRTVLTLSATTVLIAINWGVFIYAIESEQLLQASLGYFINPLLSVLLGVLFLGERLRGWQPLSVLLALSGVVVLAVGTGVWPTLALILACSFAAYGLLRKIAPVEPVGGLLFETVVLTPAAGAYLLWLATFGQMAFLHRGGLVDLGLLAAGAVTTLPLIWFTHAARRLPLATIGFLQYLAPSGQFALAVFAFGEPFGTVQLWSFALIWAGLAVFLADAVLRQRTARASTGRGRG